MHSFNQTTDLHADHLRRASFLAWFTILYNLLEGFVSIGFGISEGSIALAGFGMDSLIEVSSAFIVLWRLQSKGNHSPEILLKRERRATFLIGVLFVFLAIFTLSASLIQVLEKSHPDTTLPGLIISALSLSFMFFLWSAKKKVASALQSQALMKDADCSLACINLSFVLFAGSLLFLIFPTLWWVDSCAAFILAFFIGKEGVQTILETRNDHFTGGCGC